MWTCTGIAGALDHVNAYECRLHCNTHISSGGRAPEPPPKPILRHTKLFSGQKGKYAYIEIFHHSTNHLFGRVVSFFSYIVSRVLHLNEFYIFFHYFNKWIFETEISPESSFLLHVFNSLAEKCVFASGIFIHLHFSDWYRHQMQDARSRPITRESNQVKSRLISSARRNETSMNIAPRPTPSTGQNTHSIYSSIACVDRVTISLGNVWKNATHQLYRHIIPPRN